MPNPETRQFIERMGLAIERLGLTRNFGRLFGLLMVAERPLSLDEMVERLGVSKASVSTNARACEELGLARQVGVRGDRKDYYEAEADFWKIIKGVLREREQSEFDLALNTVNESLALLDGAHPAESDVDLAAFYKERMEGMERFFNTLDNLVATLLAFDEMRLNALLKLIGKMNGGRQN